MGAAEDLSERARARRALRALAPRPGEKPSREYLEAFMYGFPGGIPEAAVTLLGMPRLQRYAKPPGPVAPPRRAKPVKRRKRIKIEAEVELALPTPDGCDRCEFHGPHECFDGARDPERLEIEFETAPIPWNVSAQVDRVLSDRLDRIASKLHDDALRGYAGGSRCTSCRAKSTAFGVRHFAGCDLDHSLTAEQRWLLRNPEQRAKTNRLQAIKRRWAILKGTCPYCLRNEAKPNAQMCADCCERRAVRYRADRAKIAEAA